MLDVTGLGLPHHGSLHGGYRRSDARPVGYWYFGGTHRGRGRVR